MPRAIVHIGMPRTGTTSLQRVLARFRDPLAKHGVLYPELTPASTSEIHLSHQHLGEALDGRRPAAECRELFGSLKAALDRDGIDTVILSYESLVLTRPRLDVARRLVDFFAPGFAVEILVTVKPQSEYINSMYTWRTQFLKEGRAFDRYARAASNAKRLRYDALIAPWQAVAGGRIIGVPLHDPADPAPLLQRIFARVGIGHLFDATALAVAENRSPGPLAVEASRRLAGARPAAAHVRDITRLIERLAAEETGFQGIGPHWDARITERFAAGNERFAAAVWGRPWSACVAPAPKRDCNEIAGRPISVRQESQIGALVVAAAAQFNVRPRGPAAHRLQSFVRAALRLS